MECRYLDDVYELFLLGLLRSKEAVEVEEHIERGCPYCVHHLREAAQSVYLLLSSLKDRKPPQNAKAEILRSLQRT
jgi:anti-sigma factor RsiW